MKIYKVKVNGKVYEVELESVTESSAKIEAPKSAEAPKTAPAEGTPVLCPMQGTILQIKASVGASVKRGQVLMILEAMKLENEIQSPVDGVVQSIAVSKGQNVEAGKVLLLVR